jgi:hypothetical protein
MVGGNLGRGHGRPPSAPTAPQPSSGVSLGAPTSAPVQGSMAAPPSSNQVPSAPIPRPQQPRPQRLRTHGTDTSQTYL